MISRTFSSETCWGKSHHVPHKPEDSISSFLYILSSREFLSIYEGIVVFTTELGGGVGVPLRLGGADVEGNKAAVYHGGGADKPLHPHHQLHHGHFLQATYSTRPVYDTIAEICVWFTGRDKKQRSGQPP